MMRIAALGRHCFRKTEMNRTRSLDVKEEEGDEKLIGDEA